MMTNIDTVGTLMQSVFQDHADQFYVCTSNTCHQICQGFKILTSYSVSRVQYVAQVRQYDVIKFTGLTMHRSDSMMSSHSPD